MKQDIPEKFWTDWLNADEEQRIKLVQKTMIARELAEYAALRFAKSRIKKTFIKELTARTINDYFQDLAQVITSKNRNI